MPLPGMQSCRPGRPSPPLRWLRYPVPYLLHRPRQRSSWCLVLHGMCRPPGARGDRSCAAPPVTRCRHIVIKLLPPHASQHAKSSPESPIR